MADELERLRAQRRAAIQSVVKGQDETTPVDPPTDRDPDWDLDTARHEIAVLRGDVEEQRRRVPTNPDIHHHVHLDSKPESDAPGSAPTVKGWGLSVRHAPAWLIAFLGLAAIVFGALAYVVAQIATHPRPEAVPVTAPAHS